jgi:hypothetical protein
LNVFIRPVEAVGLESYSVVNLVAGNAEWGSTGAESVDDSMPEEGVYAPPHPRKVLLSEVVEFRTDQLPRRKPRITSDDSFLAVIDDE